MKGRHRTWEIGNQKARVLSVPVDASQDTDRSGRIRPLMSLGKKGRHTPFTPSKSRLLFYPEHSALSDTDRTEWGDSFAAMAPGSHCPFASLRGRGWVFSRGLAQDRYSFTICWEH